MTAFAVGIDVGGTKILGGLVTSTGKVLLTRKIPTPPGAGPNQVMTCVVGMVQSLLKDAEVSLADIAGVGVAVPGIVNQAGKVVITPNLGLTGVDLGKRLEKKLMKPVVIGNDVNFGLLGERWLGAGRRAENIVGIFPGTGVGGAIIIHNEFVAGVEGAAAELGHMIIDPQGPKCSCGNKGCLEAHAGRWAIERDIRAALKRGARSKISRLVGLAGKTGKGVRRIKSSVLAKALKAKDRLAVKVMGNAADALGTTCVSLNHIFNPEMFLFGGGLIEACGDFLLPRIERALKKDPFFKNLKTPTVVAAELGDEAVMLGAVAAIFKKRNIQVAADVEKTAALINLPDGTVVVNGKKLAKGSFVRADGKVKSFGQDMPGVLGVKELEEILRKRPELFVVIRRSKESVISPEGMDFLRKKKIVWQELLPGQAVAAEPVRKAFFVA